MASKYHENCVITGAADSFCLPCQIYLPKIEIDSHIITPAHKDSLTATTYIEKYKEDRIRKFETGYYCEGCNLLIQTLIKVDIHVAENSHITIKNNNLIKEVDDGVEVFGDIFIEKQVWNGLKNNSCYICDTDYSDKDHHKSTSAHILKLIQAKLELIRNKSVYRKIDSQFLNCLICNSLIILEEKEIHIQNADHLFKYLKCQEQWKKKVEILNEPKDPVATPSSQIDTVAFLNNSNSTIVFDKNVQSSASNMSESGENVNNNVVPIKKIPDDSENGHLITPEAAFINAKMFAKANSMKYKRNGTYCKTCNVKISSSLKKLKEHVAESSHQEKAASTLHCKKIVVNKIPHHEFIKDVRYITTLYSTDFLINENMCINELSYELISEHGSRHRCQLCEVSIDLYEVETHIKDFKHSNAKQMTFVLTDFSTEFVREVRPGMYHCGFCNLIEGNWEGLENHLRSVNHNNNKLKAREVLHKYSFLFVGKNKIGDSSA